MKGRLLQIDSPGIRLRVNSAEPPFAVELDGWMFQETFQQRRFADPESFGDYRVRLEHPIDDDENAGSVFINGQYYGHQLEKAWLYGTGITLSARGYDYLLRPARLPSGWTSNADSVISGSDWSLLREGASSAPSQRSAPRLPLRDCIKVLKTLAAADDLTTQLVAYHFGAITTTDEELHFLLFAQALEMGRALLPGRSKSEQEASLPESVKSRLPQGLNWLFDISNQRRQTRHATNKKGKVELKPDLADEEEENYITAANVLLLHLVTSRLNLPLRIFENHSTLDDG